MKYEECPECGVSHIHAPQLNFKNRCCIWCGWNDFGLAPELILEKTGAWK